MRRGIVGVMEMVSLVGHGAAVAYPGLHVEASLPGGWAIAAAAFPLAAMLSGVAWRTHRRLAAQRRADRLAVNACQWGR